MSESAPTSMARVAVDSGVLQQIRQHARTSMDAEICGVLIGRLHDGTTQIEACIAGESASQGGAHVTYTQDTWSHIYKVKDAKYPDLAIVGWYHSHPGFGVFLSDHDLFIHENFFNAEHQVAWVFDPHSDEEGCFGWSANKVCALPTILVKRKHSGSTARVGAPEPTRSPAENRKRTELKRRNRASFWTDAFSMVAALGLVFYLGVRTGDGGLTWSVPKKEVVPLPPRELARSADKAPNRDNPNPAKPGKLDKKNEEMPPAGD